MKLKTILRWQEIIGTNILHQSNIFEDKIMQRLEKKLWCIPSPNVDQFLKSFH